MELQYEPSLYYSSMMSEKEKRYYSETLPIDRVFNMKHLYGKCRKCAQKANPRPLFNFGR